MTVMRIRRKKRMLLRNGLLDVFIDGEKVGQLANGQTQLFDLDEGKHRISVQMGRLLSKSKDIVINKNDPMRLITDMARVGLLVYIAPVLGFKLSSFFLLCKEEQMVKKGIPRLYEVISEKN